MEYVDLVGWTLSDAEDLCRPLGLVAESRPAPFCHAATERREAKYRLQAGGWVDRHAALNAKWCRL